MRWRIGKVATAQTDACVNHTPQKHVSVSRNRVGEAGGTARRVLGSREPYCLHFSLRTYCVNGCPHVPQSECRMRTLKTLDSHLMTLPWLPNERCAGVYAVPDLKARKRARRNAHTDSVHTLHICVSDRRHDSGLLTSHRLQVM